MASPPCASAGGALAWRSPKNPFPHSGHLKGFSPECVCRCRVSVELLPKLFPHTLHWCTPGACGLGAGRCGRVCGSAALQSCGRPVGTVRSGGGGQEVRWLSPTGVPAPGGSGAHCDGRHAHTGGSGRAAQGGCRRRRCSSRAERCGRLRPHVRQRQERPRCLCVLWCRSRWPL